MGEERQSLALEVERVRTLRGWSKERAAREADISSITWKRIEDGLPVQDVKLAAALRVLGIAEGSVGPVDEGPAYVATGSGGPRDLSDLSLEQLADEARRVNDEMMRRLRADGA